MDSSCACFARSPADAEYANARHSTTLCHSAAPVLSHPCSRRQRAHAPCRAGRACGRAHATTLICPPDRAPSPAQMSQSPCDIASNPVGQIEWRFGQCYAPDARVPQCRPPTRTPDNLHAMCSASQPSHRLRIDAAWPGGHTALQPCHVRWQRLHIALSLPQATPPVLRLTQRSEPPEDSPWLATSARPALPRHPRAS
jgi:hypothetical protein